MASGIRKKIVGQDLILPSGVNWIVGSWAFELKQRSKIQ